MTHIYLVRHGETAWNVEGRYQGQGNPALNERGREQAYRLAEALSGISFDAAYTSDLDRTWTTTKIIGAGRTWIFPDARWRDLSFGEWEGKHFEEVAGLDSQRLRDWVNDPIGVPPPGGESLEAFSKRVQEAASEICDQHPEGNVLVVTHGGPIRCLVAEWVLGGVNRMSDVSTELGGVTLLTVHPAGEGGVRLAQVRTFDVLREVRSG